MTSEPSVLVVGRFPPPLDGQAVATRRLARLLESYCDVRRIDVSAGESALAESEVRVRASRINHYLRSRMRLKSALASAPDASIVWTSISASNLGHYRDVLTTIPSFRDHERVYAVLHWGNFHELFVQPTTKWSARAMVKRISRFVFNDPILGDRCAKWIPDDKRAIIPNTVEDLVLLTEDELAAKRMARRTRDTLQLLYLGSMTRSKGWADVVEASKILSEAGIPVRLDIVGRWESAADKEAFSNYLLRHNLVDSVRHHGGVSDRTVIKQFYGQADAFILPTYYPTEAQPHTVIEAMNAGTPIIATRHASLPGMLDEGVEGYFVPKKDPEAIAACVQRLIPFENWRRMSIAARNRFSRQFHPDVIRDLWLALIEQ